MALLVMPGFEVYQAAPAAVQSADDYDDFDLLVMDSLPVSERLPDVDVLIINPLGPSVGQSAEARPVLAVGDVFTRTSIVRLEESPLLRFVEWSGVNIRAAREIDAPWARPLVEAEGGPLLLAGEKDGRRIVILTFSLQDSDLPLQIAFPIVMANIMSWLDPGGSVLEATDYDPGQAVRIGVDSDAETIVISKPDGGSWTRDAGEVALVFAETNQIGVYEIRSRDMDGERPVGRFTVNLISAIESKVAPAADIQLGSQYVATTTADDVGQRELWSVLAVLALLALMVEWWIYHRGLTLPNRDDWFELTGQRNTYDEAD
jgi:hypothetical protein